jgi:hypothetical protein
MNKDRIDKLTWLILNHVISAFGLRMKDDKLIYIYRLPPDGCKNIYKTDRKLSKPGSVHTIHITDDLNEVFRFVNLDRVKYEEGFKDMFSYSSWIVSNCSYLTRVVISSLNNGISSDSIKTDKELHDDLRKFISYVTLSHEEIKDNDTFPAMMYYNIKEDIVRNFFFDEELEERFRRLKKKELFKNEVFNKFNADKVVYWVPTLKDNPELINEFCRKFISYITGNKVERFPDYLVDSELAEIRREVILFYEYMFKPKESHETKENTVIM